MKRPVITITFEGKPLSEKFYEEHPEIHHLYPSKEEFMTTLYLPLLQRMQENGEQQVLEISENSIKINGVEQIH